MGRNSTEAAKARLMRAVRARRTARLMGFFVFLALFAFLALFVLFAALCALFVLRSSFALCAFLCAAEEEAEPASAVAGLPENSPGTVSTISSMKSRPARKRNASRSAGDGENATLISSL
jgi:hypothetical protein